jgi:hypothetical protein
MSWAGHRFASGAGAAVLETPFDVALEKWGGREYPPSRFFATVGMSGTLNLGFSTVGKSFQLAQNKLKQADRRGATKLMADDLVERSVADDADIESIVASNLVTLQEIEGDISHIISAIDDDFVDDVKPLDVTEDQWKTQKLYRSAIESIKREKGDEAGEYTKEMIRRMGDELDRQRIAAEVKAAADGILSEVSLEEMALGAEALAKNRDPGEIIDASRTLEQAQKPGGPLHGIESVNDLESAKPERAKQTNQRLVGREEYLREAEARGRDSAKNEPSASPKKIEDVHKELETILDRLDETPKKDPKAEHLDAPELHPTAVGALIKLKSFKDLTPEQKKKLATERTELINRIKADWQKRGGIPEIKKNAEMGVALKEARAKRDAALKKLSPMKPGKERMKKRERIMGEYEAAEAKVMRRLHKKWEAQGDVPDRTRKQEMTEAMGELEIKHGLWRRPTVEENMVARVKGRRKPLGKPVSLPSGKGGGSILAHLYRTKTFKTNDPIAELAMIGAGFRGRDMAEGIPVSREASNAIIDAFLDVVNEAMRPLPGDRGMVRQVARDWASWLSLLEVDGQIYVGKSEWDHFAKLLEPVYRHVAERTREVEGGTITTRTVGGNTADQLMPGSGHQVNDLRRIIEAADHLEPEIKERVLEIEREAGKAMEKFKACLAGQ